VPQASRRKEAQNQGQVCYKGISLRNFGFEPGRAARQRNDPTTSDLARRRPYQDELTDRELQQRRPDDKSAKFLSSHRHELQPQH